MFWTFDEGFNDIRVSQQEDVDAWFDKAKCFFDELVSKHNENDLEILICREIEVKKYLESFQSVRDQAIALGYECPEIVSGLRFSRIVGKPNK